MIEEEEFLRFFPNLWNRSPSNLAAIRYTRARLYLSRVMRVYAGGRSISKGLRNFIHRSQSRREQWSSMRTIYRVGNNARSVLAASASFVSKLPPINSCGGNVKQFVQLEINQVSIYEYIWTRDDTCSFFFLNK